MTSQSRAKTAARPFDTIHDILRSLSLVQALVKGQNGVLFLIVKNPLKLCQNFDIRGVREIEGGL